MELLALCLMPVLFYLVLSNQRRCDRLEALARGEPAPFAFSPQESRATANVTRFLLGLACFGVAMQFYFAVREALLLWSEH